MSEQTPAGGQVKGRQQAEYAGSRQRSTEGYTEKHRGIHRSQRSTQIEI
jgi:hypothetical protein